MKKVILLLSMVLLLGGFVVAMEDSVTVKTNVGNEVKVYAWPVGGGPLLNVNKGIADENGEYVSTFFSLTEPLVKFQVIVIKPNGAKIRDDKFEDSVTDEEIIFDCSEDPCVKRDPSLEASVEDSILDGAAENVDASSGDSIESEVSGSVRVSEDILITGNAVGFGIRKTDGSINYIYPGIGISLFALFLLLSIVVSKRKTGKLSSEEKELIDIEGKVKSKEDEIKKAKEEKGRKVRIEEEKKKLVDDEKELSSITGVSSVSQKIEEEKRKLDGGDRELSSLRREGDSSQNNSSSGFSGNSGGTPPSAPSNPGI
ncbi:MAG: hypothetical protein IH845_01960 [Nanoarchaeota archaeon]|nr:hypothetical protein [Nanoarchaeota archaeon]